MTTVFATRSPAKLTHSVEMVPFIEDIVMDCLGSSNLSMWRNCSKGTNYPSSESGFNSFRLLIVNCFKVIFDKVSMSQQNDCEYSKWLQYVPILWMETLCWVLQLHGVTMLFVTNWKTVHKMGIPMSQGDSLVAEEIMHLCPSYEPTTLCLTKAVVVSSHVLG